MPHGQRHDGRGGEEGLAEGAERCALCCSEHVAQAQQREQVKGLRWAILRRIELIGFKIEKMVGQKNPTMVYANTGLNYFGPVCELGHRDIALLMVKSGSVDINSKGEYGQTPLCHASWTGMIEVVRALVEAGAGLNPSTNAPPPLAIARREGHKKIAAFLKRAGATA